MPSPFGEGLEAIPHLLPFRVLGARRSNKYCPYEFPFGGSETEIEN
jgi:hypothetical protein